MTLTREFLLKKTTKAVFDRGMAYYKKNYVNIYQTDQFWKGEVGIKARVEGESEDSYKVTLLLKRNQIYQYTCTCPAYRQYDGMCKHCVATALSYMENGMNKDLPGVRTSPGFRNLLNKYADQEVARILAAQDAGEIRLVPRLNQQRNGLGVEWRIGKERLYVIKDVLAFADALKAGSLVEYGKSLAFYHREEAFHPDSRAFVTFIEETAESYKQVYNEAKGGYLVSYPTLRQIPLTPVLIDRFLSISKDVRIEFCDLSGQVTKLLFRDEEPVPEIIVEKAGKDGARVFFAAPVSGFAGRSHFYLLSATGIWKCGKAHAQELAPFYQELLKSTGASGSLSNGGATELQIGARELPAFCHQILPKLKKYAQVEVREMDLSQYEPAPLTAEFYFDVDDDGSVLLEPIFRYGEKTVSALKDIRFSDDFYRDKGQEFIISQLIKNYFTNRTTDGKLAVSGDDERIFALVRNGIPAFLELGAVYTTESFKGIKILPPPKASVGVKLAGGWLDLKIDAGDLSPEQMQELLESFRRKKKYYRLRSGEFLSLEDNSISTLAELSDGLSLKAGDLFGDEIRVPAYRALYVNQVLKDDERTKVYRNGAFKEVIRGIKSVEDSDDLVPEPLLPILRGYQKNGYRWLKTLSRYGFGGILADDMGLGKTIQIITLLLAEKLAGNQGPALIVCPASLIYNWENEIIQFGFSLKAFIIAGSTEERKMLINNAFVNDGGGDVLITSYDLLKRDIAAYEGREFAYQIIDEAQYIKNPQTKSAAAVKAIRAKRRFALTGTPIENRLSELWSIFDYLMPGFLYSYKKFKDDFEQPIVKQQDQAALKRLHRMITPFILRRLKKDVLKELPEKLETVVMSKLSKEQKDLYGANAYYLRQMLAEGPYQTEKLKILAELTKLRQICCDPRLFYDNYEGESAKLETCLELIQNGIEGGHKILLFSQFTSMLSIIEKELSKEKIPYYKIIGATKKEERLQLVDTFNKDETPVFLISLKAGGTGLNLTAADIVIHYDPWWNVAAQNQATDRAHRIGQKKVVSVFKLIAKDTIEENILKLQETKKDLAEQIISEGTVSLSSLSKEDLMEILGS